jgi:hypothetical protein
MGRRRCCCAGCPVFSDDFDRDDSDDLGSDWDERSGFWSISDSELVESGTTGALVVDLKNSTREMHVEALLNVNVGDKHRIIVNYQSDSDYFFAEFESKATKTTVRLYKRSAGGNALLREQDTGVIDPLTSVGVCIDETSMTVFVAEEFVYACNPVLHKQGFRAGLGNGGTSEITFDEFGHERFEGTEGACCSQQCLCTEESEPVCIPPILTLTLTAAGSCAALDGLSTPLFYDGQKDHWQTASSWPPTAASSTHWTFTCGSSVCNDLLPGVTKRYMLDTTIDDDGGCILPDECLEFASVNGPAVATCTPLYWRFPRKDVQQQEPPTGLCGACDDEGGDGWWYAEVTV